jgi:hypothetical protein
MARDTTELTLFIGAMTIVMIILYSSWSIYRRCDKWDEEKGHPTANLAWIAIATVSIIMVVGFGIRNALKDKFPGLKMPSMPKMGKGGGATLPAVARPPMPARAGVSALKAIV